MSVHNLPAQTIENLYGNIRQIIEEARSNTYRAANLAMVQAYWNIGKLIIEEEQNGNERAEYGSQLIKQLSKQLKKEFGKGFTITNLKYMRQFYATFGKSHAVRDQLSWTHYRLLLKVESEDAREFYMTEAVEGNWSTRTLERQINSLYYDRMLMSTPNGCPLVKEEAERKKELYLNHIIGYTAVPWTTAIKKGCFLSKNYFIRTLAQIFPVLDLQLDPKLF